MEYEIDREALKRFRERWARIDAMEAELDEMADDITERSRKADEDIARLGADLEDLKRGCNDLLARVRALGAS